MLAIVGSIIAAIALILQPKHQVAPEFSITGLQGEKIDNQILSNKVTLINFWFPSCPGCVSEMPKLIKMAHDYQGKNFQIIGLAVPVDSVEVVREYVRTHQLPFTVAYDDGKQITKKFVRTELYPTSILLNQQGQILKTFVGEPNFNQLYQEVDGILMQ